MVRSSDEAARSTRLPNSATCAAPFPGSTTHTPRFSRSARAGLFAALFLFCCAAALLLAQPAHAKSYTVDKCTMDAVVGADGSLSVVETREYDFSGDFTLVGRILDAPGGGSLNVQSVSACGSDGKTVELSPVAFQSGWRDEGGPGGWAYALDEFTSTIYTFGEYTSGKASVTWRYTYTNALTRYSDVAELYWQFVGSKEEVAVKNVELSVHLPGSDGAQVVAGDNVRAWGHGSLDATVSIGSDGVVSCSCPRIASGSFAELRTVFPSSWAADVAASCVKDSAGLDSIVSEEQKQADAANAERSRAALVSTLLVGGTCGLSALLLVVAVVFYIRRGRERTPQFQGEYWRGVPAKGLDPAVVGRIVRWNRKDAVDVTAQLVHLSAIGAVSLEKCTEEVGRRRKEKETMRLRREGGERKLSALDAETLDLVFAKLAGADSITPHDLACAVKDDAQGAGEAMQDWQGTLDDAVSDGGYFEEGARRLSTVFTVLSACAIVAVFMLVACVDLPLWPALFSLACAVASLVFARKMKRRSREGAEIAARAQGLKRWFKDFTNLKEAVPTDAKVWGELLAYAALFGVAKEVVEKLRVSVPELWEDDMFVYCTYWWLATPSGAFTDSFTHTLSDVQLSNTFSSSGSGAGGGFSLGGGGGFGGGGGGFAR